MCLAEMGARGIDQGKKPLQTYTRSLYWSVMWPSIASRDKNDRLRHFVRKQATEKRAFTAAKRIASERAYFAS